MARIAASLKALLTHLIDYAGLYPPATLPIAKVTGNYERYLHAPENWMVNRLVLPAAKLSGAQLGENWRVTLLVDDIAPDPLPKQVETLESKGAHRLSLPTYCEVPLDQVKDGFAKVRTGGLTPEAIPSSDHVADFLCHAAARRIPFKATAGLHHPIRSERPLTYAADSPHAIMHGFINVFLAAAFAWHDADRAALIDVLNDTDPHSFEFLDTAARWRDRSLSTSQIETSRRDFAHSFGSCSFDEPVADLRALGWLP